MAVIKAINSKSSVSKIINYVADKDKTNENLMYGKDCSSNSDQAIEDMKMTKKLYKKEDGRKYKHFVQSFNPKDNIAHEKAHEIGKEWAEKNFKGHEVFVATHTDKSHIHNHFIVNTVNFETGEKYRQSKADLERYKELSNKICEREGLTPTEPNKTTLTSFNNKKYKALEKGMEGNYRSYMLDLWKNVNSSMKNATSKDQFIDSMKQKGYGVKWSDTRKYITFTPPKGKPIRSSNLADTFKNDKFTKEGLLDEFNRNGERIRDKGKSITTGKHISGNSREHVYGEQGKSAITSGINNPANKVIREDVGRKILFGGTRGANAIPGSRSKEPITSNEGHTRPSQGGQATTTKGTSKDLTKEESRYTGIPNPKQGIEERNTGNERSELPKNRGNIKEDIGTTRETTSETLGNNESGTGNHFRRGDDKQTDLERQDSTILNRTRINSGSYIDDFGSVSADNTLYEIANRFKKEDTEKQKIEPEPVNKQLELEQHKQMVNNHRRKPNQKSKDWDMDI